MRRDRLYGVVVSVAFLATFLLGFNRHPKVKPVISADQNLVQIEMPKLPPPPPEPQQNQQNEDQDTTQVTYTPPSLVDVPNIVPNPTFVQQVEPPPPPDMVQSKGVVTIPATRPTGFGRGLGKVFDLSQLDQIPVARVQQQPIYPYEMRRQGITGEVDIEFIVTTTGDVVDAYVIKSTNRAFEAPAIQAVSRWKFTPGRRGGKPVNTRMFVPIMFNFND